MSIIEDKRWIVYCDVCNPENNNSHGRCAVADYNTVMRGYSSKYDEKTGFFYSMGSFDGELHGGTGAFRVQICRECVRKILDEYSREHAYQMTLVYKKKKEAKNDTT